MKQVAVSNDCQLLQARRNEFESERVRKKISPKNIFFEIERGIALCYEHSIFDGKLVVSFFKIFAQKVGRGHGPTRPPLLLRA